MFSVTYVSGTDKKHLAPQVGFEPTTLRLTAECSTVELLRSISLRWAQAVSLGSCEVDHTH